MDVATDMWVLLRDGTDANHNLFPNRTKIKKLVPNTLINKIQSLSFHEGKNENYKNQTMKIRIKNERKQAKYGEHYRKLIQNIQKPCKRIYNFFVSNFKL